MSQSFWDRFMFGLAFGMGFMVAVAILFLIRVLLNHASLPAGGW